MLFRETFISFVCTGLLCEMYFLPWITVKKKSEEHFKDGKDSQEW